MQNISAQPRFLLLQVIDPHYHQQEALRNMTELNSLVATFGGKVAAQAVQHRVKPDRATYVGSGKVEWLKEKVKEKKIDVVVLNDIVNSGQLFRLERMLWAVNPRIAVWDRIDLTLNIFDKHAQSKEAKLQIELARIEHQGPRIFGLGRTELSRQGAGIGTRGIGETNIERERRVIKHRKNKILKELKALQKQQQTRVEQRRSRGLKTAALIGYTSAGKTSLFNALSGKNKKSHQSLFTTLDSVVGHLAPRERSGDIIISDTIGFIENLPPALINTFRSTLMETLNADVLLHVVDIADAKMERKIRVVNEVLESLDATEQPVMIFNKIDLIPASRLAKMRRRYSGKQVFFVSAATGDGISELKTRLEATLN
jgi:GTP-binding protein HflX